MKEKGWLYCGNRVLRDSAVPKECLACRQEINKPHYHKVYESCFGSNPATDRVIDDHVRNPAEKVFIDWDTVFDIDVVEKYE